MSKHPTRVLFARVGRMKFYCGIQKGDEKPIGGGKHNEDNIGHELYNFRDVGGILYGYFQPWKSDTIPQEEITINLERIDPELEQGNSLDNVLVVFVARHPRGGQFVIGWYDKATVFRHFQPATQSMSREDYSYNLKCSTADAVLLPMSLRQSIRVPRKDGLGRAHVCYLYDRGRRRQFPWIRAALEFIGGYTGGNLLIEPDEDEQQELAALVDGQRLRRTGQGFLVTPALREALEDYGVKTAMVHFRQSWSSVKDVGATESFDLLCKSPGRELRVEVKATQSDGGKVFLTPNEVEHAKQNNVALFILHSIRVEEPKPEQYLLSGGSPHVLSPWRIMAQGTLKEIVTYEYKLNRMPL
ncbi:MAG: DUF3883 domain-containing protein [Lentisphaerae bacterium]|nr:DUF3883 domain-containing protein [Lentisphaerota bacterium]